jgi:hypothetical protein
MLQGIQCLTPCGMSVTLSDCVCVCVCTLSVYCAQIFTKDDLEFQKKILYRSGLGDETHAPPCEHSRSSCGPLTPSWPSFHAS